MCLGILAASVGVLAVQLVNSSPLTLDSSAWYFGASLTYMAALVALAAYAAWVSVEGRGTRNRGSRSRDETWLNRVIQFRQQLVRCNFPGSHDRRQTSRGRNQADKPVKCQ
jgi:hypothetical protein